MLAVLYVGLRCVGGLAPGAQPGRLAADHHRLSFAVLLFAERLGWHFMVADGAPATARPLCGSPTGSGSRRWPRCSSASRCCSPPGGRSRRAGALPWRAWITGRRVPGWRRRSRPARSRTTRSITRSGRRVAAVISQTHVRAGVCASRSPRSRRWWCASAARTGSSASRSSGCGWRAPCSPSGSWLSGGASRTASRRSRATILFVGPARAPVGGRGGDPALPPVRHRCGRQPHARLRRADRGARRSSTSASVLCFGCSWSRSPGSGLAVAVSTLAVAACSAPCARASRRSSTAASTGAGTTPSGRSRRSAPGCATRSTSTASWASSRRARGDDAAAHVSLWLRPTASAAATPTRPRRSAPPGSAAAPTGALPGPPGSAPR